MAKKGNNSNKKIFLRGKLRDVNGNLDAKINGEFGLGDIFESMWMNEHELLLHFHLYLNGTWLPSLTDMDIPHPYVALILGDNIPDDFPWEQLGPLDFDAYDLKGFKEYFMKKNRMEGGSVIKKIKVSYAQGFAIHVTFD
ncbi:MAG: hypothetical protein HUK20_13600 [Fibrobacter sp.]|nr:hypothetical protein [Fibrobacter sp.]